MAIESRVDVHLIERIILQLKLINLNDDGFLPIFWVFKKLNEFILFILAPKMLDLNK